MKQLFCLLFLGLPFCLNAQTSNGDCTIADYNRMLKQAKEYMKEQRYDKADLKFRATRVCQPQKAIFIDSMLTKVREAIIRQKITAENASLVLRLEKFDPTLALNIAKENLKSDSINVAAISVFKEVLSRQENIFYSTTGRGHEHMVMRALFINKDSNIITGSLDGTIRIWDIRGKELLKLDYLGIPISSIAVCETSKQFLTGHYDGTIVNWDFQGKILSIHKQAHDSTVTGLEFAQNGEFYISGGKEGDIYLWNAKGSKIRKINTPKERITNISISPNGNSFAVAYKNGVFRYLNLMGEILSTGICKQAVSSIAISPNGRNILLGCRDSTAQLWDTEGHLIHKFTEHKDWVESVGFSANGGKIITGCADNICRIWDIDGTNYQELKGHENLVLHALFNKKGDRVLTASADKTFKIWCPNRLLLMKMEKDSTIVDFYFDRNAPNFILEKSKGEDVLINISPYFQKMGAAFFSISDNESAMQEKLTKKEQEYQTYVTEGNELLDSINQNSNNLFNASKFAITNNQGDQMERWIKDPVKCWKIIPNTKQYVFGHESGSFVIMDDNFNELFIQQATTMAIEKIQLNTTQDVFAISDERSISIWKSPEIFINENVEKVALSMLHKIGFKQ